MTDWTALRTILLGDNPKSLLPPRVRLPVLPQAAIEFSRRSQDENASTTELATIIESDVGLTCELLRHVNSSAYGLRRKISTAKHAIATLGIRESCLFLVSTAISQSMKDGEQRVINLRDFAAANLERALFAQEVASLLKVNPDLAFSAAMLSDFLLPIVTDQLYPLYHDFLTQKGPHPQSLADYERANLGWDHARAGASIMSSWGFPDDLVVCVLMHHRGLRVLSDQEVGRTAVAAVAIANLIPDAIDQVPDGLAQLLFLEQKWKKFRLLPIAEKVEMQFSEFGLEKASHCSLLERCQRLELAMK